MKTLMWKELRTQGSVIVLGLVLLLTPLIVCFTYGIDSELDTPAQQRISIMSAIFVGLSLAQVAILGLGASIIAGERQERTAEFMGVLPISRFRMLCSKALFCLACIIGVWGLCFISAEVILLSDTVETRDSVRKGFLMLASISLLLFGVSWLGSSVLAKPLHAVLATLIITGGAVLLFRRLGIFCEIEGEKLGELFAYGFCAMGIAGFVAGWLLYQRRVEP